MFQLSISAVKSTALLLTLHANNSLTCSSLSAWLLLMTLIENGLDVSTASMDKMERVPSINLNQRQVQKLIGTIRESTNFSATITLAPSVYNWRFWLVWRIFRIILLLVEILRQVCFNDSSAQFCQINT